MKKLIAVLGLSTALLLAGCEEVATDENVLYLETIQEYETDYGYGEIVRDPDTGCLYVSSDGDDLAPYYDVEGKVAGCGDSQNY